MLSRIAGLLGELSSRRKPGPTFQLSGRWVNGSRRSPGRHLVQERDVLIEDAQDLVAALVGDLEDRAVDAGLLIFPQRGVVGRGPEDGSRQRARVSPGLPRH